ncbi:esterase/lipase family protein [Ideonella sp.]|uniref:esterase/lipase family protein n=1 Tax=Ideonella sp. TaxID=1929293 RepID=UPI003BB5EA82
MIERLQRSFSLLWLVGTLLGLWLQWQRGSGFGLVLVLVVALGAHAVWLALTFALMVWQRRRSGLSALPIGLLLRAWWAEALAAPQVFFWRQPFRSRSEPDFLPPRLPHQSGLPGVLLVHGFVCNRGFWNPWLRRFRDQGRPVVAISLEPVFGSIDEWVPGIEAAVQRLEAATGLPPLLVGHSMGGLAIRAWLRVSAGDQRIRGVITLGTPHGGTWLAHGSLQRNGQQMRIGSDWLQALAAAESSERRRRILCLYSACDNIVFPAPLAVLPGAAVQEVVGAAHVDLIDRPECWAAVNQALNRDAD